jgi:hypothetical protein
MGYTDKTLGKNMRKPTAGPLGKFKGKATSQSTVKLTGYGKGTEASKKKSK